MTTPDLDPKLLEANEETALEAITSSGAKGVDLVDAWVRRGNARAVAVVAERGEGAPRKAARRGLNVLRSRGVKVEPPPRVASAASSDRDRETVTEAWLAPPDGNGTVLIAIASRSPTSRAQGGFFYVHDQLGVQSVSVGELSTGKLKESLRRAASATAEPVRISVEYARRRIAEAREAQRARGIPEPLGMTSAKPLLEPVPNDSVPHPLDSEGLELSDEDAQEFAQKSLALHNVQPFRGWFPERAAIEELLVDVGDHLPREGQPSPEEFEQVMKEAVAAATDRYFGPERRELVVRRMKDAALSALSSSGEVRALEIVGTMRCIERAGLITNPPRDIPFLRAFFDKAVAMLAMQNGGRLQIPRRAAPQGAPAGGGITLPAGVAAGSENATEASAQTSSSEASASAAAAPAEPEPAAPAAESSSSS
jgi:hypothetical protein